MAEEVSTKEKILLEAMELFSTYGYKTVTVRTIASKVGIRDSGLYKHYPSKRAIFEAIVATAKERFLSRAEVAKVADIRLATMKVACLSMFNFQTTDLWATSLRKILMSEMFHDKEMADIYKEIFINMPIRNESIVFDNLIKSGFMKKGDAKVYAMELYAPFFLYHSISFDYTELEGRFKTHVDNFIKAYFTIKRMDE